MHIVLLGDSTLDNKPYTDGGPDVVTHLNRILVNPERATLLAVDGAMMRDVAPQLDQLGRLLQPSNDPSAPEPPTHIVLSVGGNDLLSIVDVLDAPVTSVSEALVAVNDIARGFGEEYRALLANVLALKLPTVVCAVYNGAFPDPGTAKFLKTALRVFDHEIVEAGLDHNLPVVDLRRVCNTPEDYWNPIEPSERGGAKIAAALVGAVRAPRYDVAGVPVTLQGTGGLMG